MILQITASFGLLVGWVLMYLSCPNNNVGNRLMVVLDCSMTAWLIACAVATIKYGVAMGLCVLVVFPLAITISPVFTAPFGRAVTIPAGRQETT